MLHREAHLRLWRAQVTPRWSEKEAELRAIEAARPRFFAFLPRSRREQYLSRLAAVQASVTDLRGRVARLDYCEPRVTRLIEDEIAHLLRDERPEYARARAAQRQQEEWVRCVERFSSLAQELTRALGNVRNVACSGYARHTQAYSAAAIQAFGVANAAAQQLEEAAKQANKLADAQLAALKANGVSTRPLPRLPDTSFSGWVTKINAMPLAEAQAQFDVLIETTKRLHETAVPELRAQAERVQAEQDGDIRHLLMAAWERFRAEVASEIFPGDTERSVSETERLLAEAAPAEQAAA